MIADRKSSRESEGSYGLEKILHIMQPPESVDYVNCSCNAPTLGCDVSRVPRHGETLADSDTYHSLKLGNPSPGWKLATHVALILSHKL